MPNKKLVVWQNYLLETTKGLLYASLSQYLSFQQSYEWLSLKKAKEDMRSMKMTISILLPELFVILSPCVLSIFFSILKAEVGLEKNLEEQMIPFVVLSVLLVLFVIISMYLYLWLYNLPLKHEHITILLLLLPWLLLPLYQPYTTISLCLAPHKHLKKLSQNSCRGSCLAVICILQFFLTCKTLGRSWGTLANVTEIKRTLES